MSLDKKKVEERATQEGGTQQGSSPIRNADVYRERYSKAVISRQLKEAEYKDSLGMELSPQDVFLIENGQFFRKLLRKR